MSALEPPPPEAIAPTAVRPEGGLARLGGWVLAHFAAYRRRAPWPFLWRISIESLVVPIAVIALLHLFVDSTGRPDLEKLSAGKLLFSTVVVAPLLETLLLQTLPVGVARLWGAGFRGQLLAGWVLFALAHFAVSPAVGIGAGICSGFYLAFTYAHWRQERPSFALAFWMTTASHALHNGVAVGVLLAARAAGVT